MASSQQKFLEHCENGTGWTQVSRFAGGEGQEVFSTKGC